MTLIENVNDHKKEIAAYLKMPDSVRTNLGDPCTLRSKFDFQARVFLAPFLIQFLKVRTTMKTSLEKAQWHQLWLSILFERFPDLSPDHPKRDITDPQQIKIYCKVCLASNG